MIHQGQYIKDGEYILWAWSLQEETRETTETNANYIETLCLDCGATNVGEDHECSEELVA